MIRAVTPEDSKGISEIYNHYILNSTVTFEKDPITPDEMRTRIESSIKEYPWVVCEKEKSIIGYAYAVRWKPRHAYQHSVESTVYLKEGEMRRGIGTKLYSDLLGKLKKMNIHAVMGGIALPNDASIALHEKMGFQKVAQFKEVGYKFEKWVDVGYWELIL